MKSEEFEDSWTRWVARILDEEIYILPWKNSYTVLLCLEINYWLTIGKKALIMKDRKKGEWSYQLQANKMLAPHLENIHWGT